MSNIFIPSELYMEMALKQASLAEDLGEVPVGALVVQDHNPITLKPLEKYEILSSCHNTREWTQNPVGHAELLALQKASEVLGSWRLPGCSLYVTLEPCLMCAGAIILSRVDRVIFAARDPKAGAVASLYQVLADTRLNHRPQVFEGILKERSSVLLKEFFARKRKKMGQ